MPPSMALQTTVNGITYPREVQPPEGTPPGWKCIEQLYHTGAMQGKTYTRFSSPDGKKGILSVKAAIKIDADSKGLNGDKVAAKWEANQNRKKKERVELRETRKEQASQLFVDTFGNIDGNTLSSWSGWSSQVKLVPSGQLQVVYIGPDQSKHGSIKKAQVWMGHRMLEGEDLASEHAEALAKAGAAGATNQARQALRNELESAGISHLDKGYLAKVTMSHEGTLTAGADEPPAEPAPPTSRRQAAACETEPPAGEPPAKVPRLAARRDYAQETRDTESLSGSQALGLSQLPHVSQLQQFRQLSQLWQLSQVSQLSRLAEHSQLSQLKQRSLLSQLMGTPGSFST